MGSEHEWAKTKSCLGPQCCGMLHLAACSFAAAEADPCTCYAYASVKQSQSRYAHSVRTHNKMCFVECAIFAG